MDILGRKHFEEKSSASHRATLLDVVEEVGLSRSDANAFLDTDELVDFVWDSYGATIREKGIEAIPFFVFLPPGSDGGPFRQGDRGGKSYVVRGSADPQTFFKVFDTIWTQDMGHTAASGL